MCKQYGYARISTSKQNIERQIRNISAAYPEAILVSEAYTGTKTEGREKFERLRHMVRSGDTIIFDSVSRMSRNAAEGVELYKQLFAEGVELVFLKEPQINTETYKQAIEKQVDAVQTGDEAADELTASILAAVNRYMMRLAERQIVLAFEQSEKEVEDLHQRTREGIETARLAGKQIGQIPGRKLHVKKAEAAKSTILAYSRDFKGHLSDVDVLKLAGISRNSYYKYKRELAEEQKKLDLWHDSGI